MARPIETITESKSGCGCASCTALIIITTLIILIINPNKSKEQEALENLKETFTKKNSPEDKVQNTEEKKSETTSTVDDVNSFDEVKFPCYFVTSDIIAILSKDGTETRINENKLIKITSRSESGILKISIEGDDFVASEPRVLGKIKKFHSNN